MKINKKDFKAWLELHENEMVGVRAKAKKCPLTNYVNNTMNARCALTLTTVVVYESTINGRSYSKKLPDWAKRFISKLDYTKAGEEAGFVAGKDALEILNEAN